MYYTTLGRTGLNVSMMGLGCGITKLTNNDPGHTMLQRALQDDLWDVNYPRLKHPYEGGLWACS